MSFQSIYDFYVGLIPSRLDGLEWLAFGLAGITLAFTVINAVVGVTAVYTWFERRAIGRIQARLGPNRWGPFGLFQPLADVLKLITKEDTVPEAADRPVFNVAPIVLLFPAFLVFAIIPFGTDSFLGKLNVGVLFIVGITGVNTFGILMGGWGSRNKYAVLAAMRGAAMLISYEVPMALALAGVVVLAGSLSLMDIVLSQDLPFALVQPLGFFVFLAAASAEMNRTPFDMIEAESELVGGYNTEYSGMKFGIFMLAEFMAPLVTASIATVVFLGGTRGWDPVPGQFWFVLKALAIVLLLVWIRATWPRLRVDQIMGFAWKGLFPLAIANMFVVAAEVQVFQNAATGAISSNALWAMAGINWVVAAASLVAIANVLGQPRLKRREPVPSPLANMEAEGD